MKYLKDSFYKEGTEYSAFKEELVALDKRTKVLSVKGHEVIFLSLCSLPEYQRSGKIPFYILSREYLEDMLTNGTPFHVGVVDSTLIGEELREEMEKTTGLLLMIDGEKYIVSDNAIVTLSTRACVTGEMTVNHQNLFRDMHFADAVHKLNDTIRFVYREEENESGKTVKKIFAAMGNYYADFPQQIICDIADDIIDGGEMGDVSCKKWNIDQNISSVHLEFPDVANDFKSTYKLEELGTEFVPGIILSTSDTGASAVSVKGCYRIGRSLIVMEEYSRKHACSPTKRLASDVKGEIIEGLLEDTKDKIFEDFRKLPECLCNLMSKNVLPYEEMDLSKESDSEKNLKTVNGILKNTIDKNLDFLSKGIKKELIECVCDETNSSIHYTYADIALLFLTLPGRLDGIDDVTKEKLSKACGKIPFTLESTPKKTKAEKATGSLVLLPL